MIAPQRHRTILNRILDIGAVRVGDLARDLEVTEETIRRDLALLSDRGVLERTHGGAVSITDEDGHLDLPHDLRTASHPLQKEAIARAAAALITPGSVIALDSSSTVCRLARLIPDQPLTVVTNSLVVCSTLADRPRIEVICTGGTLDPEAMAFFGLNTHRDLARLNIQRLFFSCRGLDLQRGLSEANDRHASVKLAMIEASRSRTLLVDTSKLGLASTVFYAPISTADHLIVNASDDTDARDAVKTLRGHGHRVDEAQLLDDPAPRY